VSEHIPDKAAEVLPDKAVEVAEETVTGEHEATPFIALTGVTIVVGVIVAIVIAIALVVYFASGGK
jgi:hypothetical protein